MCTCSVFTCALQCAQSDDGGQPTNTITSPLASVQQEASVQRQAACIRSMRSYIYAMCVRANCACMRSAYVYTNVLLQDSWSFKIVDPIPQQRRDSCSDVWPPWWLCCRRAFSRAAAVMCARNRTELDITFVAKAFVRLYVCDIKVKKCVSLHIWPVGSSRE